MEKNLIKKKYYVNFYISTISFLSNCSNFSSKFASIPMNFIKLKNDLQLTIWSLGQFMFTKNIFSKIFD